MLRFAGGQTHEVMRQLGHISAKRALAFPQPEHLAAPEQAELRQAATLEKVYHVYVAGHVYFARA